jgi:parallel beta-helix repeat protein
VPRRLTRLALVCVPCLVVALAPVIADAAASYWVDGANPNCSDFGTGTASTPFCTINGAAKKAVNAGDLVQVQPGTYREQVTVAGSGTSGADITFQAVAPGVTVVGTSDLSDVVGWASTSTTAWSRPYAPSSPPRQVFLDGNRLATASSSSTTTPNSFFYDSIAKVLYVDVGGANPADGHAVEAGAQTYGFFLNGKSHVVVDGFATRGQNSNGIKIFAGSDITVHGVTATQAGVTGLLVDSSTGGNVRLDGDTVSDSLSVGIRLLSSSGNTLTGNISHDNGFHGISLQYSPDNTVRGNTAYNNVKPDVRSANGIDVELNSTGVTVSGNRTYDNQDSGIQVFNGSDNSTVSRNVSYRNGDHGVDVLNSSGVRVIGNTSYGNEKDGVSLEGASVNATIADNVFVDNGLTTKEFDVFVDAAAVSGTTLDLDLIWNSAAGTAVKYNLVLYPTLTDFKAAGTGQEIRGVGANTKFHAAASGDFRLDAGSPAIDAADASVAGFAANDFTGQPPVNDPLVTDTGAGSPAYADLGAYEYRGPVAQLTVNPASGKAPLSVTADASGSTSLGAPIVSYAVNCGNGTTFGPGPSATAPCSYAIAGPYTVTATVTDGAGFTDRASAQVTATDAPPTARLTASPQGGYVPQVVTLDASNSTDADGTPIKTYRFDCGNGTVSTSQSLPLFDCNYASGGTFTAQVTVTDTAGLAATTTTSVLVKPPVVLPPGGALHAVTPSRILDTRTGNGAPKSPVPPDGAVSLQVTGRGGVSADGVIAVVLNITVTQPTSGGYLTVYPAGAARPASSNLNFGAGQTVPNLVNVAVGSGGRIVIENHSAGWLHVIGDVSGWFATPAASTGPDGRYNAITPFRLLDTRQTAPIHQGQVLRLQVTGRSSGGSAIPASGVSAVVLNVTITGPTTTSFVAVYPTQVSRPNTSTENFVRGQTIANRTIVPVGPDGAVNIYNSNGTTQVVVDVSGWYTNASSTAGGATFVPLPVPRRLADSRPGGPPPDSPWGPNMTRSVAVAGQSGVPLTNSINPPTAVVANITATNADTGSYLTVFPGGTRPLTSDLNFGPGHATANLTVARLAADGSISVDNRAGRVDVIVDVFGWYA